MKKTSFLAGAAISTIGIFICKFIGLIYVIPFYAIIGTTAGALYSYAYSIYNMFLNLATSGIPIAMSKVISEYNSLEYYNTKEKAFKIGLKIISVLCIISFLILMIFANTIAYFIIGDVTGGNSIEDVAKVIRLISFALLVVPFLSVAKGYLQGHKIMTVSSIANIIEQVVRVLIIVIGSYVTVRILGLSPTIAVQISVFSAFISAIASYLYVRKKIQKERKFLKTSEKPTEKEKTFTNKSIAKKIILYALPFVIISFLESGFTMVDIFTVVKSLSSIGYPTELCENVLSVIATWGSKLNMIVMSIATGMVMSLIPAISSCYALKDYRGVNQKVTQAISALFLIAFPLAIGMSYMSNDVWTLFYGYNELNSSIFKILILSQIPLCLWTIMLNTNQTMNKTKNTIAALACCLIAKICLNVPFMHLFQYIGIESYYAPIVLNIIIDVIAAIYLLVVVKKETKINYKKTISNVVKIILCTSIMIVGLMILNLIIPFGSTSRLAALLELLLYGVFGIIIYFVCAYKSKLLDDIFGKVVVKNALKKIIKR